MTLLHLIILTFALGQDSARTSKFIETIRARPVAEQVRLLEKRITIEQRTPVSSEIPEIVDYLLKIKPYQERIRFLSKVNAFQRPEVRLNLINNITELCEESDCVSVFLVLSKDMTAQELALGLNTLFTHLNFNHASIVLPQIEGINRLAVRASKNPSLQRSPALRFALTFDQMETFRLLLQDTDVSARTGDLFEYYRCLALAPEPVTAKIECFKKVRLSFAKVLEYYYSWLSLSLQRRDEVPVALLEESLSSQNNVEFFVAASVMLATTKTLPPNVIRKIQGGIGSHMESKSHFLISFLLQNSPNLGEDLAKSLQADFLKKFSDHPLASPLARNDRTQALAIFPKDGFFHQLLSLM